MPKKQTKKEEPINNQADVDIQAMSDMSEEQDVKSAPKYTLSSIRMNGNKGVYYRTIIEDGALKTGDDGKAMLESMGKNVSGVILKVKKTYFQDATDFQLYTNEVGNGKNVQVSVFEKRETTKGFSVNHVFKGTPEQVKQRFPEISMIQVVYFLLPETGEIVRLKVKGMSLGQIFAYWKEFAPNEHIFEFITELGSKKEKNKYGSFYVNTFNKGDRVKDMSQVQTAIKEVYDNLTQIEEYYAEREVMDTIQMADPNEIPVIEEEAPIKPIKAEKENEIPVIEEEAPIKPIKAEKEDEIDVKDIPF